jgi:hypothetical protein
MRANPKLAGKRAQLKAKQTGVRADKQKAPRGGTVRGFLFV